MNKAQIWAIDYFKRFDTMVEQLKAHQLIDKVVYMQFEGLTDEAIKAVEEKINNELNEQAEDWEIENFPFDDAFVFDDYMKEFYKISNGLHLSWTSHLYPTNIGESQTAKNQPIINMPLPDTSGSFHNEGFVALFGLDQITSPYGYKFTPEAPYDTRYGESLRENGGMLCILDYFDSYFDVAMEIKKNETLNVVLGEDHSACYEYRNDMDFVMYMEFVLSTFGSTYARSRYFTYEAEDVDFDAVTERIFEQKNYDTLLPILEKNRFTNIETLIKENYEDHEEYCTFEHFKSKSIEIYELIERVLGISIEEEFDL